MAKWYIRDREAGNLISEFADYAEAEKMFFLWEEEDKRDGIYTDGFYEIVCIENGEVVFSEY